MDEMWRIGSSPHTRGLLPHPELGDGVAGIIPAHAGFTAPDLQEPAPHRDHPRTRGVYAPATTCGQTCSGSSPHTRGLRRVWRDVSGCSWIIPAHAGFTRRPHPESMIPWDHPRTRGVYRVGDRRSRVWRGSSPHTRGLPGTVLRSHRRRRIIPAHAGFTVGRAHYVGAGQDHPRTRGVYVVA